MYVLFFLWYCVSQEICLIYCQVCFELQEICSIVLLYAGYCILTGIFFITRNVLAIMSGLLSITRSATSSELYKIWTKWPLKLWKSFPRDSYSIKILPNLSPEIKTTAWKLELFGSRNGIPLFLKLLKLITLCW